MQTSKTIGMWLGFVCISAIFSFSQTTYSITPIGVLGHDNESSGLWINNLGEVVGCSGMATAQGYPCTGTVAGQHAFLWSKGNGIRDLGTLHGGTISAAQGINDAGVVTGYSTIGGQPSTSFYAFQWTKGMGMVNLGTLSGGASSAAFQVNSAGMISGDSFVSNGTVKATTWTNGQIKNLGGLPNAIFTAGLDVNDNGSVVGESVFAYGPPFKSHGFLWASAGMKDLGVLSGGVTSIANSINTAGVIVGQSDGTSTGGHWHAVLWDTAHKIHDLGVLPGGNYSIAFSVNDSRVVVGYGNIGNNAAHAMVWTSAGGMKDLNSLIPANSGWVLVNANSINELGQITGYGVYKGHNRGFLLTPQ